MFGDYEKAIKILDTFKLCWGRHTAERAALEDLRDLFCKTLAEEQRLFEVLHKEAGDHSRSITEEDVIQ